jgi:hypothetical protein
LHHAAFCAALPAAFLGRAVGGAGSEELASN